MIIAETLRLYPPTGRMYVQQEDGSLDTVEIEKMQRTGERWEPDPIRFRPERWIDDDLAVSGTENYILFRRKVDMPKEARAPSMSQCPSRLKGGPKLIAILVGALLEAIDDEWELDVVEIEEDRIWALGR